MKTETAHTLKHTSKKQRTKKQPIVSLFTLISMGIKIVNTSSTVCLLFPWCIRHTSVDIPQSFSSKNIDGLMNFKQMINYS